MSRTSKRTLFSLCFLLISIFSLSLVSAVWTNDLNTNLETYWKFDEVSGTLVDSLSKVNFTEVGSPFYGAEGIVNTGIKINNSFTGFQNSSSSDLSAIDFGTTGDYTFNLWINFTDLQGSFSSIFNTNNASQPLYQLIGGSSGNSDNNISWATGTFQLRSTADLSFNEFHMITGVRNNSGADYYLFIDSVLNNSAFGESPQDASAMLMSLGNAYSSLTQNITLVQFSIWSTDLNQTLINDLFSGGAGTTINATAITLNSPEENAIRVTGKDILFNVTNNITGQVNTTLFFNGVVNETISISGLNNITIFTKQFDSLQIVNWSIETCTISVCSGTSNRTLNIENVQEINQTFNTQTIEGNLEDFLATISLSEGISISQVSFFYNGTEHTGEAITSGNNIILRNLNFVIPSVTNEENVTFFWSILLSNSDLFNLSSQNQTISNLSLDGCGTFTTQLFNFSMVDEELQTNLSNTTLEISIEVFSGDRTSLVTNFSDSFENINPVGICINIDLNNTSYKLDSTIQYTALGYALERFNIANSTLDNESLSQNITLFILNETDSTEFQLTFIGSDFIAIEGALVFIDREYISEGVFKTVEIPKTDSNGQTVLHLVRNDATYNIRIIKEGIVLGTFSNVIAFCEDFTIGDCKINLNAIDSTQEIFNYDTSLGITFTDPFYNSTSNLVTFSFLSVDGTAKTVTMQVNKNDVFGNRSVCNATLISSGGSISCSVGGDTAEETLVVSIFVNGVLTVIDTVQPNEVTFGNAGYFIFFAMLITFVMLFSDSKSGILIGLGLGFVTGIGLGMTRSDIIGRGSSGLWIILIILIGLWKLNKERQT